MGEPARSRRTSAGAVERIEIRDANIISRFQAAQSKSFWNLARGRTGAGKVRATGHDRALVPGKDFALNLSAAKLEAPAGRRCAQQPGRSGIVMRTDWCAHDRGPLYRHACRQTGPGWKKEWTIAEISIPAGGTGRWCALQQGDHDQRSVVANPRIDMRAPSASQLGMRSTFESDFKVENGVLYKWILPRRR